MQLNQAGVPIAEVTLLAGWSPIEHIEHDEMQAALNLLCAHLNVEIVRTNKTKHGTTEIVLRDLNL